MTIKFVSLNLWFGGELFDEIVAFLQAQDADIVVLQEAFSSTDTTLDRQYRSMQVLAKELGYPYTDFAPAYRDFDHTDSKAQRGNGILSKFPVTDHGSTFFLGEYTEAYRDVPPYFKDCPRNLQHAQLATPAGEVNVYNIQGVWDLDGDSYSEQRRQMSEITIRQFEDKPNVILAGDTNAKMTNQCILDIEEHLTNIFGRELLTTFNMRRKDNPGYATAAVDSIFVSPTIQVIEKTCHDDDVSDHLALSAVLAI